MYLCVDSSFQSSSSECSNLGASLIGVLATFLAIYFASQVLPQSCRGLTVIIFQFLVAVSLLLSIAIIVLDLVVKNSSFNSVGVYVVLVSRILGWIVTFLLTHKLLSCAQAKLMFASATWCLTQIISSGFSANVGYNGDTNDVAINLLLICYCLISVLVLLILSIQMCRLVL